MVNSVQRLQEMKAFVRMSSGLDLKKYGWFGDGKGINGKIAAMLAHTPASCRMTAASCSSPTGTAVPGTCGIRKSELCNWGWQAMMEKSAAIVADAFAYGAG